MLQGRRGLADEGVRQVEQMIDGLGEFSLEVFAQLAFFGPLRLIQEHMESGDMEGAAEELLKYCMAGGKILKGLQNRRIDERAVFLS